MQVTLPIAALPQPILEGVLAGSLPVPRYLQHLGTASHQRQVVWHSCPAARWRLLLTAKFPRPLDLG